MEVGADSDGTWGRQDASWVFQGGARLQTVGSGRATAKSLQWRLQGVDQPDVVYAALWPLRGPGARHTPMRRPLAPTRLPAAPGPQPHARRTLAMGARQRIGWADRAER